MQVAVLALERQLDRHLLCTLRRGVADLLQADAQLIAWPIAPSKPP